MPVSQVRPLTPIARPTIAEEIVERITNYILDENLKPGVKLPSERELMTRLSVGRSSLREAIKTLGAIGIVEVRVGEGMFVGHGQTSLLTKPLAWGLLIGEHSLREVIEARRLIEVELVSLAALRATEDDLAEIAAELDAMGECLDDTVGFVTHDHAAMGAANGQPIIVGAQQGTFRERLAIAACHGDVLTDVSAQRTVCTAAREHDAAAEHVHALAEVDRHRLGLHVRGQAANAQRVAACLHVYAALLVDHRAPAVQRALRVARKQGVVVGVIDRQRGIADAVGPGRIAGGASDGADQRSAEHGGEQAMLHGASSSKRLRRIITSAGERR